MSSKLPENFRRIRLELAREPGHPEGEHGTGYTLIAPLDADGYLDADGVHSFREYCKVVRFKHGSESVDGYLRRRRGGSWAFHYDFADGEDDDAGYRLGQHKFKVGEYVTVLEDEGAHTYRVASVERL